MQQQKQSDPLDAAQLVTFGDRAAIDAFARAAIDHFLVHPAHRTFTQAEIHPHLLAIRWGCADQAVLVCQIDEALQPLIFMDCLPERRNVVNDKNGDIQWSLVLGANRFDNRVDDPAEEAWALAQAALSVLLERLGWAEDSLKAVAARVADIAFNEVARAYRLAEKPLGQTPATARRLREEIQRERAAAGAQGAAIREKSLGQKAVGAEPGPPRSPGHVDEFSRFRIERVGPAIEVWEDDFRAFTLRSESAFQDAVAAYQAGERSGKISGRVETRMAITRALGIAPINVQLAAEESEGGAS